MAQPDQEQGRMHIGFCLRPDCGEYFVFRRDTDATSDVHCPGCGRASDVSVVGTISVTFRDFQGV